MMNNLSLSLAGSATKAGVGQAIMKKSAAGASLLNINEEIIRIYEFDIEKEILLNYFEVINKEDTLSRRKNLEKIGKTSKN